MPQIMHDENQQELICFSPDEWEERNKKFGDAIQALNDIVQLSACRQDEAAHIAQKSLDFIN